MTTSIAVNGFGRIGRLVTRLLFDRMDTASPQLQVIHINEMHSNAETSAYLLEYDTSHGKWVNKTCTAPNPHTILITDTVTNQTYTIRFTNNPDPAAVSWDNIDLIVECTGKHKTLKSLEPYFNFNTTNNNNKKEEDKTTDKTTDNTSTNSTIKKIVVSAPMKEDGVPNIVYGVNQHLYNSTQHNVVTAASCTTNCIAPVVQVLHEKIGICHGMITTIHNATNTQCVIDTAWPANKKEIRRTRSAGANLIPTTTGSAKAITQIFPELDGLLDGRAVRVPMTVGASIVDAVFEMKRAVTVEEINGLMEDASNGTLVLGTSSLLKGILGYESRPLVSTDYINDSRSGIVDGGSTMVIDGTMVKMYVWYDNEWGYSCRMCDLIEMVVKQGL